jgi:hypothetical protein
MRSAAEQTVAGGEAPNCGMFVFSAPATTSHSASFACLIRAVPRPPSGAVLSNLQLEHDDFSFAQIHALGLCFVARFVQKVRHTFWIAL